MKCSKSQTRQSVSIQIQQDRSLCKIFEFLASIFCSNTCMCAPCSLLKLWNVFETLLQCHGNLVAVFTYLIFRGLCLFVSCLCSWLLYCIKRSLIVRSLANSHFSPEDSVIGQRRDYPSLVLNYLSTSLYYVEYTVKIIHILMAILSMSRLKLYRT